MSPNPERSPHRIALDGVRHHGLDNRERRQPPAPTPVSAREDAHLGSAAQVLRQQTTVGNAAVTRSLQRAPKKQAKAPVTAPGKLEPSQDMLEPRYWRDRMTTAQLPLLARSKPTQQAASKPREPEAVYRKVAPALLDQLARADSSTLKLKVYRSMPPEDADEIVAWVNGPRKKATEDWLLENRGRATAESFNAEVGDKGVLNVAGHLGDENQARKYNQNSVLVEFTLKPEAHKFLFDPDYMAIAAATKNVAYHIRAYNERRTGRSFPVATRNEGMLPGYIGVKPEKEKEESGGKMKFSLGVQAKQSKLLFQLFVESAIIKE